MKKIKRVKDFKKDFPLPAFLVKKIEKVR